MGPKSPGATLLRGGRRALTWFAVTLTLSFGGASQAQQFITPSSFAAQSNGNFGGSIPIHLPPGTGGLAPSLAITYSSHSPNGLLGLGFSLQGLSAITRCSRTYAQDGVRGSVNYDLNDRFCLDGQRLVPVSGSYTNYGADGEEYRTELDSFTQIFSHGTTGNGPTYFTAKTKSGLTETFGNTLTSGVVALGISSIRAWALSQVMDTASNYYTITYTDDANGAYYPNVISYTGNGSISPQNSITFNWNSARTDAIYSWTNGSAVKIVNLLKNIQVANGSTAVRQYNLTYDNGAAGGASRLLTVQECAGTGASGNAASTPFPCMPAIPITWPVTGNQAAHFTYPGSQSLPGGVTCTPSTTTVSSFFGDGLGEILCIQINQTTQKTTGQFVLMSSNGNGTYSGSNNLWPGGNTGWCAPLNPTALSFGDFDGDGTTDMLCNFGSGTLGVAFSEGNGIFRTPTPWPASGTFCPSGVLHAVDIDGDGRADALCDSNGSYQVALSNGDGTFTLPTTTNWHGSGAGWCDTTYFQTGDFNGDGKTDLLCANSAVNAGVFTVALSNGDGSFNAMLGWSNGGGWCQGGTVILGDFNGDGKTDMLCTFSGSPVQVALSTGNGSFAVVGTTPFSGSSSWCPSPGVLSVGDFNGDGKADLMCNNGNFLHPIAYSNGDGTFTAPVQNGSPWCEVAGLIVVGDINGDGLSDMLCVDGSVIYTAFSSGSPDLVAQVGNGLGATSAATYMPLTNPAIYTKDSGANAATYPQQDTVGPYYVVSSVARSNGVGGALITNYAYAGLKSDLSGRGSQGFRMVTSSDTSTSPLPPMVSQTFYNQLFPLTGLPASATTSQSGSGSGGQLKSVASAYQCINPATGATNCPIAIGNRYFPALSTTTTSSFDLNGAPLPMSSTTLKFDNFGNPYSIVTTTTDGFSKTTANTYNNDTVHWWIGQLIESQVTATTP